MHPTPARDNHPADYVPNATDWARLSAADAGFDGARLAAAVEFALAHARRPAASPASVFAVGAGNHMIWIDPDHDLVTVLRWIDGAAVGGFMARLMAATKQLPTGLRGFP